MTADTSSSSDLIPPQLRAFAPYGLLTLIVFCVYGNIYDNGFLFDDNLLIELNRYLRGWDHIGDILRNSTTSGAMIAGGFYRPVQIMLYMVVFNLGNGGTLGFHLLNMALHSANTCLMYRLGDKLRFRKGGVFLAALLWGLHPLATEAVTYMSATADPLFAFFCLLSIVILLPDITPSGILKIIPLFLLGLFSKETTVMLPALVMATLFLVSPRRLDYRLYLRTWPLWAVAIVFAIWRSHVTWLDGPQTYAHLYTLRDFTPLRLYAENPLYRFYTCLATLPAYLALLIWPQGLHMERSFPIFTAVDSAPVIYGGLIALAALGLILWAARYTKQDDKSQGIALSWGLLWFAVAHAPDAGILIPMNSLFLEHWMYLPTVGLFLGIAETVALVLQKLPRAWTMACCGLALVFIAEMGIKTSAQNEVWRDSESFYTNIFRYGEQSARGHNNLALFYSQRGNLPGAIDQFMQAIAITDTYAETRHNLALTYLHLPDQKAHMQDAIDNLNRAVAIDPNFYRSWQTLGDIYAVQGDQEKANLYHSRAADIIRQRQ